MHTVLFSHQVADVRGHLKRIHKKRNATILVDAFLKKAYEALRQDTCTLPREARSQISVFDSIFDLSERHHSAGDQRLEISCALVCVTQLASFLGYFEQHPDEYPVPGDDNLVVGFGLGQLSASAVSCSKTLVDLIEPAVEAVRLAFHAGALVRRVSADPQPIGTSQERWSMKIAGTTEEVESQLQAFHEQQNTPASAGAYISIVDIDGCIITASPSLLETLRHKLKGVQELPPQQLPMTGLWHAKHLYSKGHVSDILSHRLSALGEITTPSRAVLSPSTGELVEASDCESLFYCAIDNLLRCPIQRRNLLPSLAQQIKTRSISSTSTDAKMFEVTPSAQAMFSKLQSASERSIQSRDLSSWCSTTSTDAKTGSSKQPRSSNIAIVGMSGRFPGATDHEMLWKLLEQGRDMCKTVPEDRFNVDTHVNPSGKGVNSSHTPYGCFIEEPGLFDARFFNMSPREATETDPMHRLALVTAYEALEQSGFVPNSTPSTQQDRVGTFYGQTCDDWREVNAAQNIATYFIPGGVRAFAPGRISYYFGFRGPSYSVDTACSSSLSAIQIACSSLRAGECDTAVTGGLNVLTAPDIFAGLSKGQFLSPTGSCKTWDELADGYCRADAVGSIILKREEDAIREKDNILGVILATATNHSADAISITHPHAGNQSYLYEKVLHEAGVDPVDVSYVEMHGTGTQAGDSNEMQSVTNVFAPDSNDPNHPWSRDADHGLHIGAVKSNVGHSEAAAGITALIKVLMMLQKNTIPPHVGIKNKYNPVLPDLEPRNVHIPFQKTQWPRIGDKPRTAFLNNFSAAGGNTAMVLQDAPQRASPLEIDPRTVLPFVVSSKSLTSLRNNIQQLVLCTQTAPEASFSSLSYTLTSRRIHHNYRVAVTASDLEGLRSALITEAAKGDFTPIPSKIPQMAFVFTGQGAFYASLGRDLFQQSSLFRSEIIYLNELATTQGLESFLPAIEGSVNQEHHLSIQTIHLALVSVQIALVDLWKSWGIKPSVVLGHSLGEYAALYAAGVLSSHDVIYLVGCRAKLLEEKCEPGVYGMLAVKASIAQVETLVKDVPYEVACLNTPSDVVLSGKCEDLDRISQLLTPVGIKCLVLDLPYAFHSQQINTILDDFKEIAKGTKFGKPIVPVISTLTTETVSTEGTFVPDYLCRQAREPVRFAEALELATEDGSLDSKAVFLEIGPHPICCNMIRNTLSNVPLTSSSLHKADTPWTTISKSLGQLHCAGFTVDWREFHRDFAACHELLELPTYKFDNKNYWIDYVNDWCLHKTETRNPKLVEPPKEISKLSTSSVQRIVSQEFNEETATVVAQSDLSHPPLRAAVLGHLVNGAGLCPSSIYADIALTLGDYIQKELKPDNPDFNINCGDMEVMKSLIVKPDSVEPQILQITVNADMIKDRATLRFATVNVEGRETTIHATCTITYEDKKRWLSGWQSNSYLVEGRIESLKHKLETHKADQIQRGLAYKLFAALVQYDTKFQGMQEVILDSQNFEATSKVNFQTEDKDGNFFFSPFWIDSLAHLSGFILNGSDAIDSKNFVYVSHGWESMRFSKALCRTTEYNSYVKMRPAPGNVMMGDVYVFEGDAIIGVVGGLKFQRIPRAMLNSLLPPASSAATKPQPSRAIPESNSKPQNTEREVLTESPKSPSRRGRKSAKSTRPNSRSASSLPQISGSSTPKVASQVLTIISQESELPQSELLDPCTFPDLGIDSLLSLQICGKIRETLEINIPNTCFVDYPTVGELKKYLQTFEPVSESSSSISFSSSDDDAEEESETSASSVESVQSRKTAPKTAKPVEEDSSTMMLFRTTIAEQMGIAMEEVVGSNDLLSLGMDSLMSICILGILREQTDLDLPSSLFVDYPSIDAIEEFLGLGKPKKPAPTKSSKPRTRTIAPTVAPAATQPSAKAVSILMQGKPKTASKTLFLFPDGSGSATSYSSIPSIDPSVAVYGLNCPYMTDPKAWTNGIAGATSLYISEIRARQPHGPYHLGGWSAGGILAYEAISQFRAIGEKVESLIFFDSPCPLMLEPLPSKLHEFLADVGLLGTDGQETPEWLLPHFEATIRALEEYKPIPLDNDDDLVPNTLAIWARQGVCGKPGDPKPEMYDSDPKSMKWLLENRSDFGSNGWDKLLGDGHKIETDSLDGHHFTLMKDRTTLKNLAGLMKDFLLRG